MLGKDENGIVLDLDQLYFDPKKKCFVYDPKNLDYIDPRYPNETGEGKEKKKRKK